MPDKSAENLARIRACDADWNENDHPRADNGQFTSGSGGGGAKVSKLQSGGKAKVQQLKNVSGALAGVNAGIEKAKKTAASQFKSNMARGEKLKADVDKDIQNLWDNHQKDWRYGHAYGRLKNKPGMEGLAERVKEKGKGLMKEYSDKYDKLMQKKQAINEEYGPDGRRDDLRRKNYEKTMNQLYPQKQALEAEQKKFQGAKKTLEKARPGIRQMKAEKLGYNKLTGEKASNHPEGEAHNMMVGAMESAGGDFYAAKNRLLNNPGTSEKVRAALKKMKAPAGSKPASMDGLVQKYIDDGDNERAATAIELRSEMKMGNDIHQAVHNLLSKYDEAVDNGWIDRDSYDKNVDMLLNDVSGAAWDVLNPPKPKAPASKKNALVSKINSDPKLKAEVMSLKGKPKAAAPAAKPAKSESSDKPKTFFDKEKEKAEKSFDDFREIMQRRRGEINVLNERLRTTKNSFIAKATKQELDRKLREYDELDQMY